jgi:DNA-binding response OmpR family regulator
VSEQAHFVVVDDEEDIRSVVARYLVKHGYDVSEANGGAALRAVLAERPVDLVILDITMPVEDGLSIARYLRGLGPDRDHHADGRGRAGGPGDRA